MEDEWAICLSTLNDKINVILCCNHKYHYECFTELKNKYTECPLCRKSFYIKYYKNINYIKRFFVILFLIILIIMNIIPLLYILNLLFIKYFIIFIVLYFTMIFLYNKNFYNMELFEEY